MTGVLVTGGTGKTGRALVEILREAGVPVRVASRTPSPGDPDAVRFAWDDATTHRAALRGMDRVYLVAPPVAVDPMPLVEPFLAEAEQLGVQRVVLLGSAIEFPNAPGMLELAARVRDQPGWVVLRPSGFMQNFLRPHPVAERIRSHGEIRTAAGHGRVGWIDAQDIAAAAAAVLGDTGSEHRRDYVLTGPKALSYHDTAAIISARTGRTIRVVDVDHDEQVAAYLATGMPIAFAESLAAVDVGIGSDRDARVSTSVLDLTGRPPRTFDEFARRHADEWADARPALA